MPVELAGEAREKSAVTRLDRAVRCQLSTHDEGEHFGLLTDTGTYGTALWLRWRGTDGAELVVLPDCSVTAPGPDGDGCRLFADHTAHHTRHNAHELDAMRALAERYGAGRQEYGTISPTYTGTPEPLAAQAPGFLDRTSVFKGCPAGHTFFHVDPHGLATMCKVGRENPVDLMSEGLDGLLRLPGIADAQMLRTDGCGGCRLSGTCRVCRPLAKAYQEAKAPLNTYCQHGSEEAS